MGLMKIHYDDFSNRVVLNVFTTQWTALVKTVHAVEFFDLKNSKNHVTDVSVSTKCPCPENQSASEFRCL